MGIDRWVEIKFSGQLFLLLIGSIGKIVRRFCGLPIVTSLGRVDPCQSKSSLYGLDKIQVNRSTSRFVSIDFTAWRITPRTLHQQPLWRVK